MQNPFGHERLPVDSVKDEMSVVGLPDRPRTDAGKLWPVLEA
jgi:hypothetical protein